jgi:hypothetical protein
LAFVASVLAVGSYAQFVFAPWRDAPGSFGCHFQDHMIVYVECGRDARLLTGFVNFCWSITWGALWSASFFWGVFGLKFAAFLTASVLAGRFAWRTAQAGLKATVGMHGSPSI